MDGRVARCRRLTGGLGSDVHQVGLVDGSAVVLRRYGRVDEAWLVTAEAANLSDLAAADVPAPTLVAADPTGSDSGGRPALLMSRVPGRIDLTPADPAAWLGEMARAAAAIHATAIDRPRFEAWYEAAEATAPDSAMRPHLWRACHAALAEPEPDPPTWGFVHRDLQHFNVLWSRGRLRSVVDWTIAGSGPPEIDIGHAMLNVALLHGAERALGLRAAYQAEVGRPLHPWWLLLSIGTYSDHFPATIPIQVAGRCPVDSEGMTGRVEVLLEDLLRLL